MLLIFPFEIFLDMLSRERVRVSRLKNTPTFVDSHPTNSEDSFPPFCQDGLEHHQNPSEVNEQVQSNGSSLLSGGFSALAGRCITRLKPKKRRGTQ